MKKFKPALKLVTALLVSFAFILGSATVLQLSTAAQAAETPFTCTSDFYQVSNGNMYHYSVSSNTYTVMTGNSAVTGLNAIGYNTGDNFIYGIAAGSLYQIGNDGSHAAAITLTGVAAQSTGGDFIAPNKLLTVSSAGAFTLVNTSTKVVAAFGTSGATWAAYDLAYDPSNTTVYGMDGTTLYIGKINAAGTSVAVTTAPVSGSLGAAGQRWGAAYVDASGDGYFFDNSTFDLVEISAAGMTSATPTAISITQANSLAQPNDGASCPTASSPLAPTVVTTAASSVTTSTATLNGTVATGIPVGSNITSGNIVMCYSTSSTVVGGALSVSPVCAPTTPSLLAANTAATAVTLPVTGLSSGTTYYYQLQATNAYGLEGFGGVLSVTTVAANHTVTFNNNGGTGTMANEVNNAATALTTDTFTRAGYTFGGWNTAANGSGTSYADGASYPFTADVTLYAQWTAIPTKTVTFNNNGGTGTMANEVNNVPTALTTDTFTRAGYTFSGWNTAANGSGTAYADAASYSFAADVTLYAQWTALPNHTVTFNNNGGTGTMANEVNNVPAALTADTFTRAGYTFGGWNTAANGSGTAYANSASYPFAADVTLYAQWTAIPTKTVTFNNNGGTGTMSNEVANVPTALTTDTFTRAGYTFGGWNTAANGSGTAYADAATYPFAADATLYAQWTPIPNKTVTFNNNGGSGTMTSEVNNVPAALTTHTFTRAGYTFNGWNTAAGGTGTSYADGATYAFAADVTLYAQWTALPTKTVTFNNNGGTGTMSNEVANVPTALTAETFTRAGYNFSGWNTLANGTGTGYADSASYPFSADATLYAQWTPIAFKTVTFNNNGGTGTMTNESDNVPTALTGETFTRAGYTFGGWNTAANGSGASYADGATYSFAADATMYAQWTPIPTKTVTFNNNGGTGTMSNDVANVPTALSSDTFTRAGYTFAGWNTAANGSGTSYADTATYPFSSDATLYAQWTAIPTKTVTFDNNGGSGTMTGEVDNVPTALTTSTFTRAGYTFGGWNTAANGTGTAYADGASYSFAADATMFAQWNSIANKTVTFDNNGGTGTMSNEVANVPTALTTDTFTRTGYTFGGWNTAANGSGTSYADAATFPFTSNATLYAQWTAIPNKTVTFDNNGGTGTMSDEAANVPTALTTDTFTRAGYNFAGWNTAANGSGTAYADAATFPFGADATLYAQWTAIPNKTVTFDNNNGSGTMSDELANVPTALTTDTFTRAGYTFGGWNTAANGTGTAYADGASYYFGADATMYAQWTPLPNKTVTFDNNNGSGTMSDELANVPTALTADSFTRAGYTFAGWNTAANGSGTAYADSASFPFSSDATLYAQWTAIPNSTVSFDNNGGTGTMSDQVDNVPTALTTDTFTRAGYTFGGWNTAADGSGTSYGDAASYPFDSNATLFAQWTAIPNKTVTFDNNGGSGTMSNEVANVPTALTTDTFTRAGYTFGGWNTAANGSGTSYADDASFPFSADATLYAQWTAIPNKTVTFDNNNGSGTMSNEVANVPTALTTDTFTRAGYTFVGWNTAANGSGTAYTDGASYPFAANATLYAQWTNLPTKTVTFDNNGGTGTMANETNNVPAALTAESFTRSGFTFAGWNTAANGSGTAYADSASYPFSANATLYAQWTAIPTKTVTFDNNNGSGIMSNEVDNVPTALTTHTFTRAGYTFTGWNTAANGSGTAYADSASYSFAADLTLFAQWTAIPNKTVTFNNNNGSGTMSNEVANVPTGLTANSFTRTGYTFAGWNTAANGSGTAYANAATFPFSSNATLYAQWTAIGNKTVTFDNNNGSGTMANQVDNVPTALTTHTFTRAGYTFVGWNTSANGSGTPYTDGASYSFAADATLFAQWTNLPTKTVTFDNNNGSGTMADEVNNVPTALTSDSFTRAGYTFAGWNTSANGTGTAYADAASYPFTANATLFAQWTAIPNKTVTFSSNGGAGTMADESHNVATALTTNTLTRTGYTFTGWNTAANGSGTPYADGSSYSFLADATMFAQWTSLPVLTFDPNGGTGSVAPMSSDIPTTLPNTTVARPGYTFTGWNTQPDGSGTSYAPGAVYPFAASGTLFAQFTKILAYTGVDATPSLTLGLLLLGLGLAVSSVALITRKLRKRGAHATW